MKLSRIAAVVFASIPYTVFADEASLSLEALAAQLKAQQVQIEALTAQVESQEKDGTAGLGWFNKTTLGGYGEMHFSHLNTKGNDAQGAPALKGDPNGDSLDFHRFVLYVGHQFNDDVKFFSEFELEHSLAGQGKPGEIELEQAYIDWRYSGSHHLVSGLFLLPVGYFNETHEPETFYGVERPIVEQQVIPGVWWEGGVMGQGELAPGIKYDVAVTSGLNTVNGDIRAGRQKVAKANADDHAYTVRLRYTGIAGLDTGVTYQRQQDITQGDPLAACFGTEKCGQADMLVGHVALRKADFGLRAVYAQWEVEGLVNGAGKQWGWYVEPSYKVLPRLGVFARYSELDNKDGVGSVGETRVEQVVAGVNFWLTDRVVFKADVQNENLSNGTDKEGFNLGVGLSF